MNVPRPFRLLFGPERWQALRHPPATPPIAQAAAALDRLCLQWRTDRSIPLDETSHNWHLIRARNVQTRAVSLLVQYRRTGDRGFRDAALDYVRDMAGWEYWSWIRWREHNPAPDAIFDLSYGENALTLALVQDALAAELDEAEQTLILDTARRRALQPYLACNGTPGRESWYYRSPNCNWNTVCNGGAGMLALALGDRCPESAAVLPLVEDGIRHYFEFLDEDGAWPEGIGYWGYGHRYGYFYLLSREAVDGRPHPLLERPGSRNTLRFPLLFSPNGTACGFGDSNAFFPLPFHLLAARRYGLGDVADELERRFADILADDPERMNRTGPWPGLAELLLTAAPPPPSPLTGSVPATDREAVSAASPAGAVAWPAVAIQRGLDWCTLADAWPQPRLYASVRGGHTDAPHVHQDLTSMMVVAGRERLLENVNETEYSDSTFSPRRFELYETSAGSKNMLFVNGLGYPREGRLVTTRVAGQGWEGVLLDGTAAQKVGADVVFCGRAVLLLDRQALLVLDRVVLAQPGYAEVRWHSFARVQSRVATAAVVGKAETLHMAFAANWPAGLSRSSGLPTQPGRMPDTVLRWMARHRHTDILLATLIAPRRPLRLAVAPDGGWIAARGPGFAVRLHTSGSGLNLGDA